MKLGPTGVKDNISVDYNETKIFVHKKYKAIKNLGTTHKLQYIVQEDSTVFMAPYTKSCNNSMILLLLYARFPPAPELYRRRAAFTLMVEKQDIRTLERHPDHCSHTNTSVITLGTIKDTCLPY